MDKIDRLYKLLKQPSTLKGLIVLAGVIGVTVTPQYAEAIGALTAILYAVYQILRDEDKQIEDKLA